MYNKGTFQTDTIVAQASPPGRGGVSIIRLSGPQSKTIAAKLFLKEAGAFKDKQTLFVNCYGKKKSEQYLIDEGIVLFFKAPKSFTGEDVIEFQCHGSPIVVDKVISEALNNGARLANPGEFSERAFLNGKIDLVQAEAIADLIDSQSTQAAKNALETLKGTFSKKINLFNEELIQVRMYLEAAIDFPDEEDVDFIGEGKIKEKIQALAKHLANIYQEAEQGQILQEGMNVVLAGEPNAGKSSLLNTLSQKDSAIVTQIAGTTRDVLKEHISINGMALNIIDTAGLRESDDLVEQEGVRRAHLEIEKADLILYLFESSKLKTLEQQKAWKSLFEKQTPDKLNQRLLLIENKIDLGEQTPSIEKITLNKQAFVKIALSAKYDLGVDLLKQKIIEIAGLSSQQESKFAARRRHIDALQKSQAHLDQALSQFSFHAHQTNRPQNHKNHPQEENTETVAAELVAEDLRLAHRCLGEITGEFSSDDLLGEIFSGFCIGK